MAVAALVLPSVARAHGGQLLFAFLYLPHIIVAALLMISWRAWGAARTTKVWTSLLVLTTSGILFAVNYAFQYRILHFTYGNRAYLIFVAAQIVLPGVVWWMCWGAARLMSRRPRP